MYKNMIKICKERQEKLSNMLEHKISLKKKQRITGAIDELDMVLKMLESRQTKYFISQTHTEHIDKLSTYPQKQNFFEKIKHAVIQ